MLFVPDNDLERALLRAVKEPHTAADFYRLLLTSDLLVLGSVEGHESDTDAFSVAPGSNVKLVSGTKNGSPYLPVFSSLLRMQDYVKQESKYISVNGRALLDLTRGAPIILNPASEYGKELTPDQVRQLLDGPQVQPIGTANQSTPLVEMLTNLFAARPEVETAWAILVTFADQPQIPRPVVGIETANGVQTDWPSLVGAIEAAAQKSIPGQMFDVQPVDRRNPTGFTGSILQTEPFYRRTPAPSLN
jgi:hypothetical protein